MVDFIYFIKTEKESMEKDPKIQKIAVNLQDYIDHQIEVITDSDWFEQLVKDKLKEISDDNE